MKATSHCLSIFILAIGCKLFGQGNAAYNSPTNSAAFPPPPTAAALGKYGDVPVSQYTGIPSIRIPLFEIKSGELTLPIELNYHAGGIKVEEIPSWVGLGWSLNAGGVITRTVRGIPDDHYSMYGNFNQTLLALYDGENINAECAREVTEGRADTEPDLYYFNFGNSSGKFFMDQDDNYYLIPQRKMKIEVDRDTDFIRWKITDESGVVYTFGESVDGPGNGIEYNNSYSVEVGTFPLEKPYDRMVTSWFLVEIKHPNGWLITLEYEPYLYDFRTFGTEANYYSVPWASTEPLCNSRFKFSYLKNQIEGKRLKRINFNLGKVEFKTKFEDRLDLPPDKALEYIELYRNDEDSPLRSFRLQTGYFDPPSSSSGFSYRLKLNSVTEIGSDNSELPPYKFYYNEYHHMPDRVDPFLGLNGAASFGQDLWGYYNGETNNRRDGNGPATLISSFLADLTGTTGNLVEYTGANRSTDEEYALTYSLTKVEYPTGGNTQYEFESNTVLSDQIPFGEAYSLEHQSNITGLVSGPGDEELTEIGDDFIVNSSLVSSTIPANQQQGAFVDVFLIETAFNSPNPCSITDPAVTREIYDANTDQPLFGDGLLGNKSRIFIPNGTYYVKLIRKSEAGYNCNSSFYLSLQWNEFSSGQSGTPVNVQVGGLRIKKIIDHDGISVNNDKITTYKYGQLTDFTLSSGQLTGYPKNSGYLYGEDRAECRQLTGGGSYSIYYWCGFYVKQSTSSYPLSTTQGGFVGYENVTVEYGINAENGKTEYTYTTAKEYPDLINPDFPFPPPTVRDWWRGLPTSEVSFKKINGTFQQVQRKEYTYNTITGLRRFIFGVKLGIESIYVDLSCGLALGTAYVIKALGYQTETEFLFLQNQTIKTYDVENQSLELNTHESLVYGDHMQLLSKAVSSSDGKYIQEEYKRPLDFENALNSSNTGPAKGIYLLANQHIIEPVLQKTIRRRENLLWNSNLSLVGGSFTSFNESPYVPGLPIPTDGYSLAIANPISQTYSSPPMIQITGNNLVIDPKFEHRTNAVFNEVGRIIQGKSSDDYTHSFQWGYFNSFPVAEVKNASNNEYNTWALENITGSKGITFGGYQGVSRSFTIEVKYVGNVHLKLGVNGTPSFETYAAYSGITSGSSLIATGGCELTTITFPNVQPGTYTITIVLTSPTSGVSLGVCGKVEYPSQVLTPTPHGAKEFYFESFEEANNTSIVIDPSGSHTGNQYFNGDYVANYTIPNSRTYQIEYWYKDTDAKWKQLIKPFAGSSMNLNEGTAIDDVRIYPVDAQMKTYTYDPLLGITSITDESGQSLKYIYDSFGRLKMIKNDKEQILKSFVYHYKK